MKNIQIPFDLFFNLCRHFMLDEDRTDEIRKALEDKLEALTRRELYSKYKNQSLSDEERQQARKEYLDRVGMKEGFRWDTLK